jgi:mycothiol synthase
MIDFIMLKIREFVKGEDEEVWLGIRNEAFKEYDDFRPSTIEDMKIWEKDPGFDPVGMFIAELNGETVGRVQAYVDKQREEKKGFIQGLGVVPKLRKRGIGRKLIGKAIGSLRKRGMETAECWTRDDKPVCKHIFESMGFELIRVFSTMRRELDTIPSVGENEDVEIRVMKEGVEDIDLLRWLNDETFSDHFDFRPSTIEEWKHWCSHPDFEHKGWFFALLEGKPVGHVGIWVDSKFVKFKGIKRGWIETIGVLKPYRRKGIGTSLILRGMEYLKSNGMTEVELGVDDSNPTKATKLYEKVGFRLIRKDLTYLKKTV